MRVRTIQPDAVWPRGGRRLLTDGPIAIGGDLAPAEKKTSSPSAIAVVQRVNLDQVVRVVCRFKTSNEETCEAIVDGALNLPRGLRPQMVPLDLTNERSLPRANARGSPAARWSI